MEGVRPERSIRVGPSGPVYSQQDLADECTQLSSRVEGELFTKEPVFMLPLVTLRQLLVTRRYQGVFKQRIMDAVGPSKVGHILHSQMHDYLVISDIQSDGGTYPDMARTSAEKAPVPLREISQMTQLAPARGGPAEITTPSASPQHAALVDYSDEFPYREGDYEDAVKMDLFRHPVVTNTGYILEESTFKELERTTKECPFTRQPLTSCSEVSRLAEGVSYTLHNGACDLGRRWMSNLTALRTVAGLKEFRQLQQIPLYADMRSLLTETWGQELTDVELAEILERDLDVHVSSAAPRRRMALGSEVFGASVAVRMEQFRSDHLWPRSGQEDFFVVLPQPGVAMPYLVPVAGRDAAGKFVPPNYHR